MKLIFRQTTVLATELQSDLTLKEYQQFISQGSVLGAQSVEHIDDHHANIMINDDITYWNVPLNIFEVISDQQPLQAHRCCGS